MAFDFIENVTFDIPDSICSSFTESADLAVSSPNINSGLIAEIASIHVGLTENFTLYEEVELAKAVHTWVSPYPKPVIKNHDITEEPLGRIIGAKMAYESDGTPYIRIQVAVTDYQAIQKVLDKRYTTGSIGARADKAICTVCGVDWASKELSNGPLAPCKHVRGKVYNGTVAALRMEDISFKEYSFVNMPADQLSYVRKIGDDSASGMDSGWVKASRFFLFSMTDQTAKEFSNETNGKEFKMSESESEFLYQIMHFDNKNVDIIDKVDTNQIVPDLFNQESNMQKESASEQEDILEVTEKLTEDLSDVQDATEDVDEDADAGTEESDAVAEAEEESQEEVDSDVKEEEKAEEETEVAEEESDVAEEEPEAGSEAEEDSDDEEKEAEDEAAEETDPKESGDAELVVEDNEQQLDSLRLENEALKEENAKLKSALHRTLAERVVDTKIALGIESFSARSSLIESHASRSASSLADSLRDLAKMPAPNKEAVLIEQLKIDKRSGAIQEQDAPIVESSEQPEEKTPQVDPEDVLAEKLSAVLLNKTKLH